MRRHRAMACSERLEHGTGQAKVINWLQLLRVPNLLTVPGDPIAGFLVASAVGHNGSLGIGGAMAPAAICLILYCAGLLLNDYCDIAEDRRQRPDRPLPSGAIESGTVIRVFWVISVFAIVLAVVTSGYPVACMAAALLVAIIAYNKGVKRIRGLGPLNMGICRGLSLLLGAVAAIGWSALLNTTAVVSACFLAAYIAGVTAIASRETRPCRTGPVRYFPLGILVVWLSSLFIVGRSTQTVALAASSTLAAAAILWAASCGRMLIGRPAPSVVQSTIGRLIRCMILIQAALAASVGGSGLVVATILCALLPVSVWLSRKFYAS